MTGARARDVIAKTYEDGGTNSVLHYDAPGFDQFTYSPGKNSVRHDFAQTRNGIVRSSFRTFSSIKASIGHCFAFGVITYLTALCIYSRQATKVENKPRACS